MYKKDAVVDCILQLHIDGHIQIVDRKMAVSNEHYLKFTSDILELTI